MIERDFIVIAVHGEGDQATVNALQQHRNNEDILRLQRSGVQQIPDNLSLPPNESPDVIVVLRDQYHNLRMEVPVETWDEVKEWKRLAGWDQDKRHWKTGAIVKVQIGG